jgi:hypothetical protein
VVIEPHPRDRSLNRPRLRLPAEARNADRNGRPSGVNSVSANTKAVVPCRRPLSGEALVGVGDDMVVGYNTAGGIDDECGSEDQSGPDRACQAPSGTADGYFRRDPQATHESRKSTRNAAKGSVRSRYSRPRRAGPRSIPAEMPGKPLPRIPPCHYLPGASVDWIGGDERSRTDPSCRRLESTPCDSSVLSRHA